MELVNVCGRRKDASPAAALVKQEVSTFLAAVAPNLASGDLLTEDVVANTLFMEALGTASQGFVTYSGVLSDYTALMEGRRTWSTSKIPKGKHEVATLLKEAGCSLQDVASIRISKDHVSSRTAIMKKECLKEAMVRFKLL